MNFAWYNILGTAGVATIVITYVMLQTERLRSDSFSYSVLNAVGAILILISYILSSIFHLSSLNFSGC